MIRSRCQIAEGEDEGSTRAKVADTVRQFVTDPEEANWIERSLLTLLGFDAGMAPDELFGAWRTFFERIASQGTVALVFEDLHHADSGLLDFIEHMLDWSRGLPIYIITLSRPDLLERRPDWGAGKRSFTSIYLEPLNEAQMRELLTGLVPGLPEAAANAIVARADGIPLYAVETVRSLIADGRLKQNDEGVCVPSGDLSSLAVPETLTALISSRLDSLDPADRSLIHDAAVLGQSFSVDALASISSRASPDLAGALAALVRRELLTRQADARSAELGQYIFVQGLIREVAYNTLSKKDRKTRHLAAARYFEQLGSDELASALAGHYLAAHENAAEGVEQDALAAQARLALKAAADRAASLGSYDQAIVFLQQATKVTSEPGDRGQILERASDFAGIAGRHSLAIELGMEAVAQHRAAGDRLGAARAMSIQGWGMLNGRQDNEARDMLEKALVEFADLDAPVVIATLKANLARAYNQFERTGQLESRALPLADEALAVAEHGNHPELLIHGLLAKGGALGSQGRLREAIALMRAAEDVAREHGLTEPLLGALTIRGYFLGEVDNIEAYKCFSDGLAMARRVGSRGLEQEFVNNFGYTSFLVGEWDRGLAEFDDVLARELDVTQRIWNTSNMLIIRASRGEPIGERLAELDELLKLVDAPHVQVAPRDTHANFAQAEGRLEDAQMHWMYIANNWASQAPASYYQAARPALWAGDLEAVRRHFALIEETGVHGPVVEVRRTNMRAAIAALEGHMHEALTLYLEAFAGWGNLKVLWEQALTGIDMATVLDPAEPEVAAAIKTSRETLTRLDAKPYLERLDRTLAKRDAPTPVKPGRPVEESVAEPA